MRQDNSDLCANRPVYMNEKTNLLEIEEHMYILDDVEKPPARTGFIHLAFSVGSREAVDELTERLRHDGYAVLSGPRVTGDGYYESCVSGIEGNQIEITV